MSQVLIYKQLNPNELSSLLTYSSSTSSTGTKNKNHLSIVAMNKGPDSMDQKYFTNGQRIIITILLHKLFGEERSRQVRTIGDP